MARENHNAGLHLRPRNYKTSCDVRQEWDKYAEILATESESVNKRKAFTVDSVSEKIVKNNNVIIWKIKGQQSNCCCGSRLLYSDRIELEWKDMSGKRYVYVSGKYCPSCDKKYVVQTILLKSINQIN